MKLSVIIPCYNAAATIATELEALARQEWSEPWEVIVADNGSTDGTRQVVVQYQGRVPNLRIIDASARRGAAYARNTGARAAQGEYLAFCDADDEVGAGWVAAIGTALASHDFVASRFDYEKLNPLWVRSFRADAQSKGLQRVPYPPYLQHAGGCGLGIKRALHEAVGGFDEKLLRLMDTDYCFKTQLTGVTLHFVPEAVVHVRYRDTLKGSFQQARLWGEYNVLMYKRYRPADHRIAPLRAWARYVLRWRSVLLGLPKIRQREGRTAWLRTLGWELGQLQGGIKYRIPPF